MMPASHQPPRRASGPAPRARLLYLVLFAVTALWGAAQPGAASARELKIRNFSAEILVRPDATIGVTETIEVQFIGSWRGLYRTVPVQYFTPQGFNYTLRVKLESATDDAGRALKVESSRERHYLKWRIYVDGANDVVRRITIHYNVRNGLKFFDDHDELYWNVTGDEWDVPIARASAQILLPLNATGVRALDFTGAYGSRARDAEVTVSDRRVDVDMRRPLAFHEGLTVVVGWDKGAVRAPTAGDRVMLFLESNWPLLVPVVVFAFMFWLWYTRGRDPRTGPIAVQYAPPDGLTPAEVGTLIDDDAGMRDITATLVDLAVRGYLVIEEQKRDHLLGLFSANEYIFHLKIPQRQWATLKPHEQSLLGAIFEYGSNQDVSLESLQNRFYTHLPGIKNAIFGALLDRGYFGRRPDTVRSGYVGAAVVAGVLLFAIGHWFSLRMGMAAAPFYIAAVISALIVVAFGWHMPVRTTSGVKALAGVLGFENFLSHVEADRLERLPHTPETFEKFLPFAMALGVEKKWVSAFENIYSQPPNWYQGGSFSGGFRPMGFVNGLNGMTARVGTVMASAPRSSGGSGFGGGGGGGSSGGGFGGGGGGGF